MKTDSDIERSNRPDLDALVAEVAPWQVFACRLIAEWKSLSEVQQATKDEFGEQVVSDRWIKRACGSAARPKRFDDIIQAMRDHYREMRDEPIMDPAWRMEQRRRIVEQAIAESQFAEARNALADVERLGGTMQPEPAAGVNVQVNIIDGLTEARRRVALMSGLPVQRLIEADCVGDEGDDDA